MTGAARTATDLSHNQFEGLKRPASDPILAAQGAFKLDSRPQVSVIGTPLGMGKINGSTGVYIDPLTGSVPVARAISHARGIVQEGKDPYGLRLRTQINAQEEGDSVALPIPYQPGMSEAVEIFNKEALEFVFGEGSSLISEKRAFAIPMVGGMSANLAAALLAESCRPNSVALIPDLLYPPLARQFGKFAGFKLGALPMHEPEHLSYDLGRTIDAINNRLMVPERAVLAGLELFAKNPTAAGYTLDEIEQLAREIIEKRPDLYLHFDVAYAGFKQSLRGDLQVLTRFAEMGLTFTASISCAKNAAGYGDRLAFLLGVTANSASAQDVMSTIFGTIRPVILHSPLHQTRIMSVILSESHREALELELAPWRAQTETTRAALIEGLTSYGLDPTHFAGRQGIFLTIPCSADRIMIAVKSAGLHVPEVWSAAHPSYELTDASGAKHLPPVVGARIPVPVFFGDRSKGGPGNIDYGIEAIGRFLIKGDWA